MSRNLRLWKKDCHTWQEALMRQNGTPGKRTKENSFVTYCVGRKSETRMKNKGIRNSSWDWGGKKTKCRWKTQWERLRVPGGARREYWDSQSWDWTTLGQGVDGMKIKGCRLVEERTGYRLLISRTLDGPQASGIICQTPVKPPTKQVPYFS